MSISAGVNTTDDEHRRRPTSDTGIFTLILIRYSGWVRSYQIPFLVSSVGMIVMLFWAGSYKMTMP